MNSDTALADTASAMALNAEGMAALGRGAFAEAADLFAQAAAADPQAPSLWINLATAHRGAGDDEGERAALNRVLEMDQRHLTANIRMAELHERLGEAGKASFRWSGVLALAQALPDRPLALEQLLDHARDYAATQGKAFGEAIDSGLEAARGGVPPSERRRFDACVDTMLGRRRIYHSQPEGLHFPFLPADEFFDRSHFPWLDQLEVMTGAIRDEFEALRAEGLSDFSPYVEMEAGAPLNKWTALDHSLDWSALHLWRHGERIDTSCARCPETAAAIAAMPLAHVPRRMPTAFFSVLKPRTHLPAHEGVSNARAIIHLPLIVPPGCRFRVGGETREWRAGEAWAFDDTIEHEAWNDSDQLRAILIFDTWNPHLSAAERRLLTAFFAATDASGLDPAASAIGD
ncbi:aspartyl/asparaginyl beta-hydroxylase domain-containing protein [Sphingosinicella sp.]|uniref:aspartyl/asparaginyl beta-hydroxylase domain-containing protein n=1 Tax=Sphingosinicella sp. TaxID=1917971 RepID=UPI0040384EC6